MKTFKNLILLAGIGVLFSLQSCTVNEHVLNKYYKPLSFAPLDREDIEIVGGLTAEATVNLVGGSALDPNQAANYKDGNLKSYTAVTSIPVFTVSKKYVTTFRYDGMNDLVGRPTVAQETNPGILTQIRYFFRGLGSASNAIVKDYAMDFALFALMEKYPDMDYFTNVQIERYKVTKGKKTEETLKIKAHGVNLKTDS